jgi:hypothetical protein
MLPATSAATPRGLFSLTLLSTQPVVLVGTQAVPETYPAKTLTTPLGEILRTMLALASVR